VLLLAGCGDAVASERARTAAHGLGRLVYKQLAAVSRGEAVAAASWRDSAVAKDSPGGEDMPSDPTPGLALGTGIPPGSWVAAFPAPDVQPLELSPAPVAEAQRQGAFEPLSPSRAAFDPRIDPGETDEPALETDPGSAGVAFTPGGEDGEGAWDTEQAPVEPAAVPIVAVVALLPVVVGRVDASSPVQAAHPRAKTTLALHAGGAAVASSMGVRH
jgi:hypothetical protein